MTGAPLSFNRHRCDSSIVIIVINQLIDLILCMFGPDKNRARLLDPQPQPCRFAELLHEELMPLAELCDPEEPRY